MVSTHSVEKGGSGPGRAGAALAATSIGQGGAAGEQGSQKSLHQFNGPVQEDVILPCALLDPHQQVVVFLD
jgi:hypothetical protein